MTEVSEITEASIIPTAEAASDQEAEASVAEAVAAADSDPAVAAEAVSEVADNFKKQKLFKK